MDTNRDNMVNDSKKSLHNNNVRTFVRSGEERQFPSPEQQRLEDEILSLMKALEEEPEGARKRMLADRIWHLVKKGKAE